MDSNIAKTFRSSMKAAYYTARARNASNLAATGGLLQIVVALALGLLPVFKICAYFMSYPPILAWCDNETYLGMIGNVGGFLLLGSMVLAGITALLSTRLPLSLGVLWIRWAAVLIYIFTSFFADWFFRIVFLPGTLLILLSAGLTRRYRGSTVSDF